MTLGALPAACSGPVVERPTASVVTSSADIYASFQAAMARTDVATLRLTSTAAFFANLTKAATNQPLAVSDLGVTVSGLHDRLVAQATRFRALSEAYPTLGALIDSGIAEVPHFATLKEFQAALRLDLGSPSGMSLVGAAPDFTGTYVMPDGRTTVVTPSPYTPIYNGQPATQAYERTFYDKDGNEVFECDTAQLEDPRQVAPHGTLAEEGVRGGTEPFRDENMRAESFRPAQNPAGVYVWNQVEGVSGDYSVSDPADIAREASYAMLDWNSSDKAPHFPRPEDMACDNYIAPMGTKVASPASVMSQ